MSTIQLKVTGMTCGHCEQTVSKALAGVPGVEHVTEVNREKQTAIVQGEADLTALVSAVKEHGFEAEVAS